MNIVHIFGLDHFHQSLETRCITVAGIADEQQQKAGLTDTLRQIIAENNVTLIAAEAEPDLRCLGHRLAQEHGIGYINITMPVAEREKHGVRTPDYDRHEDSRRAAYKVFEQYMFEQIKSRDEKTILVMCGRRHLRGLQALFSACGDDVRPYDINDYLWYRGIPKEDTEGVVGYDRDNAVGA